MFNIENLLANSPYGFAKPSLFAAMFQTPPAFWQGDLRFLSYLCSMTATPSVQILTQDAKTTGYGVTQKIPYDVLHGDLTLSFFCDAEGDVVAFFDQWLRNVVSFGPIGTPVSGANQGDVQYPSNYQTTLQLLQYVESEDEIELLNYTMDNAYPTSVSEIGLDWSNGNSIEVIQVTFAYRNFWLQQNSVNQGGIVEDSNFYQNMAGSIGVRIPLGDGMSITSGIMGLPGLGNVLGAISQGEMAVQDAINTVFSVGQNINRVMNQGINLGFGLSF